jgi:hypothetical protein
MAVGTAESETTPWANFSTAWRTTINAMGKVVAVILSLVHQTTRVGYHYKHCAEVKMKSRIF